MPELIEVELYRQAAESIVGERIAAVELPDPNYLRRGAVPEELSGLLVGESVVSTARHGKLLVLDTGDGPQVGLRFGMTGRLLIDGVSPIAQLEYASPRDEPAWDRFILRFSGGTSLAIRDQRRLGAVELDPDRDLLGFEASTITAEELERVFGASTTAIKTRLLDQGKLAGLGNLLVDETLWRSGLDPARRCNTLAAVEVERLADSIVATVAELTERGGSHLGDLQAERHADGRCPRDGRELCRAKVGGRTTYWCAEHQC